MSDIPLVSVIVPNYNHAKYLGKRIDSVLNQSYKNLEVILLDDASDDRSVEILSEYSQKYGFRLIVNSENTGSPFAQWLKGVALASGEYVWIAESDDYADPELVTELIQLLQSDKEITLAYCQSWQVDQNDQKIGSMLRWTDTLDGDRWERNYVNDGALECVEYLSARNTIPNASAVIFRKRTFPDVSDLLDMKLAGDWIVWSRIVRLGKIAYCSEHLNYFRTHKNTSRELIQWKMKEIESFRAVTENLDYSSLPINTKKQLGVRLARSWSEIVHPRSPFISNYLLMLLHIRWISGIGFYSVMLKNKAFRILVLSIRWLKAIRY